MAKHCHRRRRCVATIKLKLADNFSSSVCQCRRARGLVLNSSAQSSYITGSLIRAFQGRKCLISLHLSMNCSWTTVQDLVPCSSHGDCCSCKTLGARRILIDVPESGRPVRSQVPHKGESIDTCRPNVCFLLRRFRLTFAPFRHSTEVWVCLEHGERRREAPKRDAFGAR